MNLQNCQPQQHSGQLRLFSLGENGVYLVCRRLTGMFDVLQHFLARKSSFDYISRLSTDSLRDTGLDSPQLQMKFFDRNFEAEASLREMKLSQQQMR